MRKISFLRLFTVCLIIVVLRSTCFVLQAEKERDVIEKNFYDFYEVDRHLDKWGNFYLYLNTTSWVNQIKEFAAPLKKMVRSYLKEEEERAQFDKTWAVFSRLFAESGFWNLAGMGMSSLPDGEGMYRNKAFLHRATKDNKNILWTMFGRNSHSLEGLKLMPENTAAASYGDLDINLFWQWLNDLVSSSELPQMKNGLEQLKQRLKDRGIDIDNLIASTAGEVGFLITIDENITYPYQLPNGTDISVPDIGLAFFTKINNDAIFQFIDQIFQNNPNIIREDRENLKMRTMPLPLPVPMRLRPSAGIFDDIFFIASNDKIIREVMEVYAGNKPGLTSTDEYKRLSNGLPHTGIGFSFIAPVVNKTIKKFVNASLQIQENINSTEQALVDSIMKLQDDYLGYSVTQMEKNGIYYVGHSNLNIGDIMLLQMTIVPGAIISGMMLPALSKAREKARRINCSGNLKQIGLACLMYAGEHDGKFPDNFEQLAEQQFLAANISVWGCPSHTTPAQRVDRSDYVYVGSNLTVDTEYPSTTILAYDASENHGNTWINILFVDGHVQGVPASDIDHLADIYNWILSKKSP